MNAFKLVPAVSPKPSDPSLIAASPAPIVYRAEPSGLIQPRLRGRPVFRPAIDLTRYRCRMGVDWVFLHVRLREPTQSIWVAREIASVIRRDRDPAVLGPTDQHDAHFWNYNGDEFRVKLQDPRMDELGKLAAALDARWGLAGEIAVVGIEVAVDFYAKANVPEDEVDADRHRMVAVIQRHHFVPLKLFSRPDEDRRYFYKGNGQDHTSFVVPESDRAPDEPRSKSASSFKDRTVNEQILGCGDLELLPMPVDGTLYWGRKNGEVMFRVQNKIYDGSDPDSRGKLLCLRKRRARVEVTLLEEGVRKAGIETLEDLAGFDFATLKTDYFCFYLPSFPGEPSRPLMKAVHPVLMRCHRDMFLWGGCYMLDLYDRARLHFTRGEIRRMRKEAPEIRLPKRERLGQNGRLVAWDRLNDKVGKALEKFTAEWPDG